MFGFTRKSGQRSPTDAVRRALESDGLPPGIADSAALGVTESHGNYAGRKVTYIRVFDPARAAEAGLKIQTYADLDAHPNLVLRKGHVEKDGTVVITWRAPLPGAETPARQAADRAMHTDGQFVHPGQGR